MTFLTDWLANIIAFLLLAAVMDLLLPSTRFQQYAKVVIGLLLLFVMLQPLWKILSVDIEEELSGWTASQMDAQQAETAAVNKKSNLETSKELFILKNSEQQLQALVESELKQTFQKQILEINIQVSKWENSLPENIEHVDVYIVPLAAEQTDSSVKDIHIDSSIQTENKGKAEGELASFLSKKWNIPEEQLNIHMVEEGDSLE
ncbi:stage III sporulation protein AF [Bacillus aerolatus]|uniref:Stage III sporulation protein AF n=1 Tax=Bacillus aerolatus TaxID=2653354 RepID=A0A6I1FQ24_9BACI|nr:stage III sporulation protein AF [Bacillus aerolatus]KAB7708804.1 stage III sporulation protein AF [Bacillus aerolatus]